MCDVSTGSSLGLLLFRQGEYLGAKAADLKNARADWYKLYNKGLQSGLVSIDHLEFLSDFAELEPSTKPGDEDEDDEDTHPDSGVTRRPTLPNPLPAPALPPKRTSFKKATQVHVPGPVVDVCHLKGWLLCLLS